MTLKLLGRKKGMTQIFDEEGRVVVCTVIEMEPNVITQVKTEAQDGYNAVQLGFEKVVAKDPRRQQARTKKPQRGHFTKANVAPRKHMKETKVDSLEEFEVGQELGVSHFKETTYLDITGTSKGKGFQGVMKLHNFSGGPASHGSGFHRSAGSTGMRSTPGRCLPGGKRASQMGNRQVTTQGLKLVKVDEEKQVLLVKGAVPGAINSLVVVGSAVKK